MSEFMDSTPVELEPYIEADKMRTKRIDMEQWQMGMYVYNALGTALSNAFSKGSNKKYLEKPLMQLAEENKADEDMTEEDKARARKRLLASLQSMQKKFNANKKLQ
jgi:hypothetical protein